MYNCRLSVATAKGLKGIFCNSQNETTVTRPNNKQSMLNVLPKKNFSLNCFQLANTTPAIPKPSKAVDITRNPKWYQSETLMTLVKDNSSNNVAKEIKKMPMR